MRMTELPKTWGVKSEVHVWCHHSEDETESHFIFHKKKTLINSHLSTHHLLWTTASPFSPVHTPNSILCLHETMNELTMKLFNRIMCLFNRHCRQSDLQWHAQWRTSEEGLLKRVVSVRPEVHAWNSSSVGASGKDRKIYGAFFFTAVQFLIRLYAVEGVIFEEVQV